MKLADRIGLFEKLGKYILDNSDEWKYIKERAFAANGWFLPEFIDLATENIAVRFLGKEALEGWTAQYPHLQPDNVTPKTVGVVMAGNIPLVGFHDLLSVLISGHRIRIKPSSKDEILIRHLTEKLVEWSPEMGDYIAFAELLKNCDAYIATGASATANYFEYYFGKYPHIIRKNRSSAAIVSGSESQEELQLLARDIFDFFGMGCRNITKLYVPTGYNFLPLLDALKQFDYLADHHKYKNNYDYNLALHILNNKNYMSTAALLLVENKDLFSPVSQLHYEFYTDEAAVVEELKSNENLQCIVGKNLIPFGEAQSPALNDYADGVDTLRWLLQLN